MFEPNELVGHKEWFHLLFFYVMYYIYLLVHLLFLSLFTPVGQAYFSKFNKKLMFPFSKLNFSHGTKCAGIIAGGDNKRCGVGVAFGAQISSKGLELVCMYTAYETDTERKLSEFRRIQMFSSDRDTRYLWLRVPGEKGGVSSARFMTAST